MPNGLTIKLHGIEKFRAQLAVLNQNVADAAMAAITEMTLEMETKAKGNVPVDMGQLRASIRTRFYKAPRLAGFVECTASYAPFIEYGTGPLGQQSVTGKGPLPPGYQPSSSRKAPPIDVIEAWVKRKGLTIPGTKGGGQRQLAFLIARHIGKYGSLAHPFMYPAYLDMRPQFKTRLWNAINNGQKKSKI
jgi:hypothetical protein